MTSEEQAIAGILKDNLCTYFILPLLKLNRYMFISEDNFVDSYLCTTHKAIMVEIRSAEFYNYQPESHALYGGLWSHEGHYFLKYHIPQGWHADVALFVDGKFSQMSQSAKTAICTHSGLQHKVKTGSGMIVSDIRLQALEKSTVVREIWETSLACELDEDQELLSIPGDRSFIDENMLKRIS